MSEPWFRWYARTCEDGKLRAVARNADVTVATVIGVWASLLEDASHPKHRGVAARGRHYHEAVLDVGTQVLDRIIHEMDSMDLLSSVDGELHITAWKERQFETDAVDPTNAQRQQKWRDRHKANGAGTERNGSVTVLKRPDTDTESEKKDSFLTLANGTKIPIKTKTESPKSNRKSEFEIFWDAYLRKEGKKAAEAAFAKALKETTLAQMLAALEWQTKLWTDPKYIPHPATWLNKGRWADEKPTRGKFSEFSGIT